MRRKDSLKTYLPFALNVFQKNLSYRANAIIFIFGDVMMLAVSYYLWKAVYGSSSGSIIKGFTLNEMIIYILISSITSLVISVDVAFDISSEVKDGSIAINLIRPISYEKRMLFQGLGNILYNFVVVFMGAFIVITMLFYHYTGKLNIMNFIFYFLSIIMGMLIKFYYSYCFGLLSFKITNMWGLSQVMGAISNLLSGTLIPIVFFPEILQKLFNFLPFGSMIYTPTMIYLGKLTGVDMIKSLIIQAVWIFILIGIAKLMWKTLIKKLTILGG
ncbi:MAG: ABC-2 family transporter protein [Inconstantimicrobium porci]|uniref:ABC transporter permease n=1 Tax=Inconstantimicrobium porci TaxID=2652291 RepID=UPI002A9182F1|nr:ABC-2 family transporter protein [Inconstantimicrobium porci]MDY5911691.1 ABC-2 family transporter protein [Inconstantimicrobium porci]